MAGASGREEDRERLAAQEPKIFPYKTIVAAANHFRPENKLGKGAFKSVYKGKLRDGKEVAVKKLTSKKSIDFIRNVLATLKHPNVVNLVGYSVSDRDYEPLLVYEYVHCTTLEEHLQRLIRGYGRENINWARRYQIIKGIAEGLKYLHGGSQNRNIIHRSIKPVNILIDRDWRPIIAGFSQAYRLDQYQTQVFTHVVGTREYIDPEYWKHRYLSKETDIYSFGILVLELISGKRYQINEKIENAAHLLDWAHNLYQEDKILKFMDPTLANSAITEQVKACAIIGLLCIQGDPKTRPDMDCVASMLSGNQDYMKMRVGEPELLEEDEDEKLKRKIAPNNCQMFSYEALYNATNKFDPKNVLGRGGYGVVYKGKLDDGTEIAVKKPQQLDISEKQEESFIREIELLSRVKHPNVVKLLGYCLYGHECLLVYEYVPNLSLNKFVFGPKGRNQMLDWTRTFDIILGTANGLSHLHAVPKNCIVHRDIKPENILLDKEWQPKVADFGISRLFDVDGTHVSTALRGTMGYIAPEYSTYRHLSTKSDVYSFGVLMLEIVSGRRFNLRPPPPKNNAIDLLDWAYKLFNVDKTLEIMDPALKKSANIEQVEICIIIALLCVQGNPKLRPDMKDVVSMLTTNEVPWEDSIGEPGIFGFRDSIYTERQEQRKYLDSLGAFLFSRIWPGN